MTYQDMFATICLSFLKKIVVHIEGGSDGLSDSERYIACVEEVGNPTIAALLKTNLSGLLDQT